MIVPLTRLTHDSSQISNKLKQERPADDEGAACNYNRCTRGEHPHAPAAQTIN